MPSVVSIIVTLVIFWLIIFFIILPIGLKMPDKAEKGEADSAPDNPNMGFKIAISLAMAIILTGLYLYIINQYPQLMKIIDPYDS